MTIQINREELAWAAGFFDGEGTSRATPSRYKRGDKVQGVQLHLSIGQCDRDVLDRFKKAVLNLGFVYGPYQKKNRDKPYYAFHSQGFEQTQAIMAMLWPFLSDIKRAQAKKAMITVTEYQEWLSRNPRKTRLSTIPIDKYCKKGHRKVQGKGRPWCPTCSYGAIA
jgi:hypothetical protein